MNSYLSIRSLFIVLSRVVPAALLGILFIEGCSTPAKTAKGDSSTPPPPSLAITVRVGSIDLSGVARRIEKKDIEKFSALLKREQIEILAVQGITRYPNVKTRVDFINELAAMMDMRHSAGESIDISGRQRANAVFSVYPIRSNQKSEFDVPSAFYESALRVSIDAGVRDVVVVTTRLPEKATGQDLAACIKTISRLQTTPHGPFIVTGNLPVSRKLRDPDMFADLQSSLPAGSSLSSHLWFAQSDLFKLLNARSVKTELGAMSVAEFGLYTQLH